MARRARELDPLSPYLNASVAFMYCWSGEYERAMQEARAALEMYPDYDRREWCRKELSCMEQGRRPVFRQ